MAQTVSRMNHIFGTDGKTFILAMDHGSNFNVLPAMGGWLHALVLVLLQQLELVPRLEQGRIPKQRRR